MECVLESEDEIKFENEMAFHPNTDSRIARWLLPRYSTCMKFVKKD